MREPARGAVWPQALALPPREVCVGQEKTARGMDKPRLTSGRHDLPL